MQSRKNFTAEMCICRAYTDLRCEESPWTRRSSAGDSHRSVPSASRVNAADRHSASSDVGLLRELQCIVDVDAQVAHRALDLRVAKQQLHGTQVACPPVDQRGFRSAHGMRPVGAALEADLANPSMHDACVLPCGEVGRILKSAEKQEVGALQMRVCDPSLQCIPGLRRNLELDRAMGLALHDRRAGGNRHAVSNVHDPESDQITSSQL